MRDIAVYAETLAFLVVVPGFVTLVVLAPLRRRLLRLDRDLQRLPPAHFRDVFLMPVTSILTGSIAGIGVNLATGDTNLGWLAMLAIGFAVGVAGWAGRLALRPAGPRRTPMGYRRQLIAQLSTVDWAAASGDARVAGQRIARRFAATGDRLLRYGDALRFRRWLAGRNRWLIVLLATATGYSAGFLVWVAVIALADRRGGPGAGLVIIVVTPLLGPAQLWLWYRTHRATLREFGAELVADAAHLDAAIAAAPPLTAGRRLGRALRTLLDPRRT
ncbi:hypothetical protein K1W54_15725 [Micromonospora sp. CPCC 205371]|nr:hypothetical protein [Micromonospora sp. CPCC 205371]